MRVFKDVAEAQTAARATPGRKVLVPTMGALHEGHAELIREARRLVGESGTVMVSIFVNPTQFGPSEDLSRYPRPLENDLKICRDLGVGMIFAPEAGQMYAADHSISINESTLARGLCGASRPGHFNGVCTVVAKLFLILQPDVAVFGEKDYQQLAIIRRMVRDLSFPVEISSVPTVREADGLALSSRNRFLTSGERAIAPELYQGLLGAKSDVENGERNSSAVLQRATRNIGKTGARIDYLAIVHAETLEPMSGIISPAIIVLAAFLGSTRLIDNLRLL